MYFYCTHVYYTTVNVLSVTCMLKGCFITHKVVYRSGHSPKVPEGSLPETSTRSSLTLPVTKQKINASIKNSTH